MNDARDPLPLSPAPARDPFREALAAEPWRFDFYATLRRFERDAPDLPRLGDSGSLREETLRLGQNPYFAFPASTFTEAREIAPGRWRLLQAFFGLLGPQGALPLATTGEAFAWLRLQDDGFARFLDLFNHRFLLLFFRTWADARPIAQADRPRLDRFRDYVGSAAGVGQELFRDADDIPDAAKIAYAGLVAPKAKSAARLRRLVRGLFGVECEVEEFVGLWLTLEPGDCSRLDGGSRLGVDLMAGGSFFSISDKIRLRLHMRDLAEYERYLPGERRCDELADLVFFHLGDDVEWEAELALPADQAPALQLGRSGRLGWTGWLASDRRSRDDILCDARFSPADFRRKSRRERKPR
jgi:type VI secretion system protein ImpH